MASGVPGSSEGCSRGAAGAARAAVTGMARAVLKVEVFLLL